MAISGHDGSRDLKKPACASMSISALSVRCRGSTFRSAGSYRTSHARWSSKRPRMAKCFARCGAAAAQAAHSWPHCSRAGRRRWSIDSNRCRRGSCACASPQTTTLTTGPLPKSKSSGPETALTVAALAAIAVAVWVAVTGGARFSLLGINVRMTDPYRPALLAIAVLAVRMFLGPRTVMQDFKNVRSVFPPAILCAVLVAGVVVLGGLAGSNIAGGADSYGYISQADLWLKGNLVTSQPAAVHVPWPDGQWTFSPLGYRPSPSRDAIVPQYSPGFPLLLAGVKLAAGQCGIGGVVPVMAGMLVALTFIVGRKVASDEIALAAAWLMATSPVLLYMLMSPMSDIPAAAFWGLAAYGCLAGSRTGAVLGGTAAAMAVLIRPNLAHVGFVMALWMAARDIRGLKRYTALARPIGFLAPVIVASIAVAWLNDNLYGAATNSGYGSLASIFRAGFVAGNLISYASWMAESQTPLALIGLVAICAPLTRVFRSRERIRDKGLLAVMSVSVIAKIGRAHV